MHWESSHTWLGFRVGLSRARIRSYILCCLRPDTVLWSESIANGWCIWSNNGIKLLIQVWFRSLVSMQQPRTQSYVFSVFTAAHQQPRTQSYAFSVCLQTPTSSSKEAQGSSTSQPLSGLASLAANLSRPSSSKSDAKAFQPGWKSDISKSSHKDSGDKSSSRSTDSSKASKEPKGEKSVSPSAVAGASSSAKGAPGSGNGGKQSTMSGSSMANANKRLQLMKKAAAKQQEKRVHIKWNQRLQLCYTHTKAEDDKAFVVRPLLVYQLLKAVDCTQVMCSQLYCQVWFMSLAAFSWLGQTTASGAAWRQTQHVYKHPFWIWSTA